MAPTKLHVSPENKQKLSRPVVTDIVVMVPGTTNPGNAMKQRADQSYWTKNKSYHENFLKKLVALEHTKSAKAIGYVAYQHLHVWSEFNWSGDNNKEERIKAGKQLCSDIQGSYPKSKGSRVSLHLIAHSHGGNVVNEFTKHKLPKKWKIKSITYLSTPFFKKKHQLSTKNFHRKCRIINVRNEFDLTQRVIADFTLQSLPNVITYVMKNKKGFDSALKKVKDEFKKYKDESTSYTTWRVFWSNMGVTGRYLGKEKNKRKSQKYWNDTSDLLGHVKKLITELRDLMDKLNKNYGKVFKKSVYQQILKDMINPILKWEKDAQRNLKRRTDFTQGLSVLSVDLELIGILQLLNKLTKYNSSTYDGYLINFLVDSLIDRFASVEDTVRTPKEQFDDKKYQYFDIEIQALDKYSKEKEHANNFKKFISDLETSQSKYCSSKNPSHLRYFLMKMMAQFDYSILDSLIWGVHALELIYEDAIDDELMKLRATLNRYQSSLNSLNNNIVVEEDYEKYEEDIEAGRKASLENVRGSISYLMMTAHSFSRSTVYHKYGKREYLRTLTDAFDSWQ
ncbi:MAG: hypothetical protein GY754_39955 [bacterium]|nr:hypothetical protein [bacterium]